MERENRMPVFRLLHTRSLFLASVMFVLGCLTACYFHPPRLLICLSGCAALALFAVAAFTRKKSAYAFLMAFFLFAGAARYDFAKDIPVIPVSYDAEVTGIVASDAVPQPDRDRTLIDLKNITVNGEKQPGGMRVYAPGNVAAVTGDRLRLTAYVWQPEKSNNPGEYDFAADLWTDGIASCCKPSTVEITGHEDSHGSRLAAVKRSISAKIEECVPSNAALLKSLLLADKTEMETETKDAFSASGTAHLLAVSGLHVSAVAALTDGLLMLTMLPQAVVAAIVAVLLLLYMFMIGSPPPVTRAVIGYILLRYAKLRGYPSDPFTRLGAAAFLMLLIRPMWIASVSFQMSFLCVFVLLCLVRTAVTVARNEKTKMLRKLGELLAVGVCGFLAQLPIAANVFGTVSPVGILVNLPAVPIAVAGLYTGIFSVLSGYLIRPAGMFFGRITDLLLTALTKLVTFAGRLPFAGLSVPAWPWLITVLFLALIAALSPLSAAGKQTRRLFAAALAAVILAPVLLQMLPGAPLQAVFLNVGQANCAAVYAGKDLYLVDTGEDPYEVMNYLSGAKGSLKGIFLTHAHIDHMGALRDILSVYTPDCIYVPAGWDEYADVEDREKEALLEAAKNIPVIPLEAGDSLMLSKNVKAKVYSPCAGRSYADANDGSMMLLIEPPAGGGLLFAGDISVSAEPYELPDADVLAAAHHGAFASTSEALITGITPGAAVISVGRNNYGHPSGSVLNRLERYGVRVYRTDRNGAVTAVYHRNGKLTIASEAGD